MAKAEGTIGITEKRRVKMSEENRKKRICREFARLVEIDAPSFGERQMADYLKKKLAELGAEVEEDKAGEVIGYSWYFKRNPSRTACSSVCPYGYRGACPSQKSRFYGRWNHHIRRRYRAWCR